MLEVVGERPILGGIERTYRVVASSVVLGDGELESATADEHFRYFATFVGTLLADFASYLESGAPTLYKDRVGYRQVPLWLTDEEFDALTESMAAAVQEHVDNPPALGRR